MTPEIEVDSDRIFQRFEFGCVTYRRSDGTFSWSAYRRCSRAYGSAWPDAPPLLRPEALPDSLTERLGT